MQHIFFASNYYSVHTHDGIDKVPQATPWGKSDLFGYFYSVTNISVTKDWNKTHKTHSFQSLVKLIVKY